MSWSVCISLYSFDFLSLDVYYLLHIWEVFSHHYYWITFLVFSFLSRIHCVYWFEGVPVSPFRFVHSFFFFDWIISSDLSSDSLILSLVLLSSLLTNHWNFHFSFHVLQLYDLCFVLFDIYIYTFLFTLHGLWDSSSLTSDWICTPCSGSVKSYNRMIRNCLNIFSFEILLCWNCSCFGLLPAVSIFMMVIVNFLSGKLYSSVSLGFLDI